MIPSPNHQANLAPAEPPGEQFAERSRMRYLSAGASGPPMLLLHGWSSFKEIWWSTLLALAPHARAFAPDLPGHGDTPLLGSVQMHQIAGRAAALCQELELPPVVLVGHSMGGNIAIELALRYPALVERLVLVDPAAQPNAMPSFTRSYLDPLGGWAALRASMALARPLNLVAQYVPHTHGGGLVRPALRRVAYMARHDADALRALLDGLFANPIGGRMAQLSLPTLVISGEFDPLVPPALSRQVAAAIPGARYTVVRGAAHNPMDERPNEFARVLLEFLLGSSRA
ncbi:MAG TPA: alpha/beta hydrolase [Kouleothrix sp.]|uniref:alpha/beta fold hydrolase n=1 Tax=Kouleothrix sp. TaxID=2779161 RepID=UPI002C8B5470|nr:alpha/beta hydrolase [Kouleothrix sp.]